MADQGQGNLAAGEGQGIPEAAHPDIMEREIYLHRLPPEMEAVVSGVIAERNRSIRAIDFLRILRQVVGVNFPGKTVTIGFTRQIHAAVEDLMVQMVKEHLEPQPEPEAAQAPDESPDE